MKLLYSDPPLPPPYQTVVPLDVCKTRLQTRPGAYKGLADAARTIAKEEGPMMLMQGWGATVVR